MYEEHIMVKTENITLESHEQRRIEGASETVYGKLRRRICTSLRCTLGLSIGLHFCFAAVVFGAMAGSSSSALEQGQGAGLFVMGTFELGQERQGEALHKDALGERNVPAKVAEVATDVKSVPLPAKNPATPVSTKPVRAQGNVERVPQGGHTSIQRQENIGAAEAASRPSTVNADIGENSYGSMSGEPVPFGASMGPGYRHIVQPKYPSRALRERMSGKVVLRVRLDASGEVMDVEVLSTTHQLFSKAAERALRASKFYPYAPDGKGEGCWTIIPIEFRLTS